MQYITACRQSIEGYSNGLIANSLPTLGPTISTLRMVKGASEIAVLDRGDDRRRRPVDLGKLIQVCQQATFSCPDSQRLCELLYSSPALTESPRGSVEGEKLASEVGEQS